MNSTPAIKAVESAVAQAIALLEADTNLVRRARNADALSEFIRVAAEQFAEQRSGALVELRDNGWSLSDLSAEFGIARSRLSQLINRESYREGRRRQGRT